MRMNAASAPAAALAWWCMTSCSAYVMLGRRTHVRTSQNTRRAFKGKSNGRKSPFSPFRRHGSSTVKASENIHANNFYDEDSDPSPPPPPGAAPSDSEVESTTLAWIRKSVIGLNLCPFAERPIKMQQLSTHVVRGDDHATIAAAVGGALLMKRDEIGTALVIAPEYYPDDFEQYMSMVQFLEQRVMELHELHGDVQIAPFHPHFTFDGSGDKVDNYTNRSPYPMFHVLRTDEVSKAVNKLNGDPGKVWRRNVRLLENLEKKLGREAAAKILVGGREDDEDNGGAEIVEEVLRLTKMEMEVEEKEGGEKATIRGSWRR